MRLPVYQADRALLQARHQLDHGFDGELLTMTAYFTCGTLPYGGDFDTQ